ncbi:MAG TPA: hypothetical protein VLX92_17535 [Kofleriaceae bacterium]|nr:hypothetical protein [Kofleriaceae bacterium]
MRRRLLCLLALLAGCPGGTGGIGDHCNGVGDCSSNLQCVSNVCVAKCERAPECGDGYSCDKDGYCHAATGQLGDSCASEVDCVAGLACELSGTDASGQLVSSCVAEGTGHPAGDLCAADGDCRDGTCALGRCVDLCTDTRDCVQGTSCTQIPRIDATLGSANGSMFAGCLQSLGALAWPIPITSASDTPLLPIPDSARSVAVTFSVDDVDQEVGALKVVQPDGTVVVDSTTGSPFTYYTSPVRHAPAFGQSVLAMPSSPTTPLEPGAYQLLVSSLRVDTSGQTLAGTAIPSATAVVAIGTSVLLDLHFYFLDFDDHPCAAAFGQSGTLNADIASSATFFQNDFLGQLRTVFAHGGLALGDLTYEDLPGHPDLDGLDTANAASLLALATHSVGINVFFVRTLSPVGLQAFGPGPNPGPAGLAGTSQSGVIIGLDTLCYRSWPQLAQLTAHELARYMGLYDNVEIDGSTDPIDDDDGGDPSTNLMFYSEMGGSDLSSDQRDILGRSPVLR